MYSKVSFEWRNQFHKKIYQILHFILDFPGDLWVLDVGANPNNGGTNLLFG